MHTIGSHWTYVRPFEVPFSAISLDSDTDVFWQSRYETLRSQLKDAAEGGLGVSESQVQDSVRTIGRRFPDYIHTVVSLVTIGTSPTGPGDLATTRRT